MKMEDIIIGMARCPQCGTANPTLQREWRSDCIIPRGEMTYGINWGVYKCTTCRKFVLTQSIRGNGHTIDVERTYPPTTTVEAAMPERAAKYLIQAIESSHAPDGAVMLAGSSVDAMLKAKGLTEGSLYSRIDQAVKDHLLTVEMGDWAHEVRLGSNRPRHADDDDPHVTPAEAAQSIEFVKTLGHILFVLPERIKNGREKSKS